MKKFFLLLCFLAAAFAAAGQNLTVKGTVTDAEGLPVISAGVMVRGSTTGTVTDVDGQYVLAGVPADAILEFSSIGYAGQAVPVEGRTTIDVVLQEDAQMLEETIVVAFGTSTKESFTGSAKVVKAEELAKTQVTAVTSALYGKVAGVQMSTTSGAAGDVPSIRIRGFSSINAGQSPLFIVDGMPCDDMNMINPQDVESMSVLKDAASNSLYGARGANGVIIVTTKSAEKGERVSVKFNSYYGRKQMANRNAIVAMDPQNFVRFQYELAKIRDNVSNYYEPYFGTFDDIDLYYGLTGNNWVDAVFGNAGTSFSTDFSISGSGESVNWTLGYAHMGDKAIMSGSNYTRDNLNFKGNFKTSSTTSIDVNVRYSRTNVRGSGANGINDTGTTSGNGRLKHAVSYAPIPLQSTLQGVDEEQDYGDNAPPLLSVADNDSKRLRKTLNANAAFNWKIMDNLNLKIEGGLEDYRQMDDRFYGLTTYYVANNSTVRNTPSNQHKEAFRDRYRNTNTLNYDFADLLGEDHSLTVLLGEEMTITKSNTLTMMVDGLPTFYDAPMAWNFLSSGSPSSTNNYYSPDDKLLSFFGRVNYDYKRRYSAGVTLRADGSSKFARGNRWGFFPSAALSWTISNEPFMENTRWIEQLKLRYSFGTAGNNNIPSGQLVKEYSSTTTAWLSQSTNYWMAGKVMNNPDLTWETTYTHNIGLDFSFFRGAISGSIEAYQNDTKDLLINFPITGSGYDSQYRNIGSTRNRGVELTLSAPIVSNKNFSLNLSGNIAYNKNVVTSLGGLESITAQSYWASTEIGDDYIVQVGQPLGNMYGYRNDGFYSVDDFTYTGGKWVLNSGVVDDSAVIGSSYLRPGALKLKDLNGDGRVTVADREVIGNASPDFTGGFSLSGYAYGFDFGANFNFMIGNQVYNANKVEFTSSRKFNNRNLVNMMDVDNRWTNIDWNTGELITDASQLKSVNAGKTMWSPAIGTAVFSDWAVEDASYLRLQSATLGYTLPESLTQKVHMRKLRLYVTGTNLFCLTKYSGYDPEVDTRRATPLTPGVDYSAYPKSIGFVAGVNITF